MPSYEYECEKCKAVFEVEQRITEPPLEWCRQKECTGFVHRLIPRTSFVLKGRGWFRDGY